MIGTAVDRYEILEELGHGGMSVVYRGLDSSLEREVAVKVLHNHLAKKVENRQRFHREAKAIARLRHPNILEVYDFSSEDAERSYIVMEYVEGQNLRQFATQHDPPPPEVAALIGAEICEALEHAHDHGIIHRDLKPENVMVSATGKLKLMDFGIAHVIDAETMTATGSLMGSPAHMAPELIDGEKVDVRADVFALGTVIYWLATGSLPFEGANAPQVLKRVLAGDYEPADVIEPKVGRELSAIIACCLARAPDDRYPTVSLVRKALLEFAARALPGEPKPIVQSYLVGPAGYLEQFDETIVEKLTAMSKTAQKDRDVPGAIALFNRILAYEPNNAEVQQMLDRLCRRDRWVQGAPMVVGFVVIACAVAALMVASPFAGPDDESSTSTATDVATATTASNTADAVAVAATETVNRARQQMAVAVTQARRGFEIATSVASGVVANPLEPVFVPATPVATFKKKTAVPDMGSADGGAVEEKVTHMWRFLVTPMAATLEIDGVLVDVLRANAGIPLTEGPHTIRVRSEGTSPWVKQLNVTEPGVESIVLQWKPGGVSVNGNVPLLVWFDGAVDPTPVSPRGRVFRVPFGKADSTDGKRTIKLRAAYVNKAREQESREVVVTAGSVQPVSFQFDPIP